MKKLEIDKKTGVRKYLENLGVDPKIIKTLTEDSEMQRYAFVYDQINESQVDTVQEKNAVYTKKVVNR